MAKKFFEAIFKTENQFIKGFLQGFLCGSGKAYRFFISSESGVKAESFSDKLKELAALSETHKHVIIEEEFLCVLKDNAAASRLFETSATFLTAKPIKRGEFFLKVKDASMTDALSIKQLISDKPTTINVADWQAKEITNKDAKGIELYTPLHDYLYDASGSFSGEIEALIDFRQKLSLHSSVTAGTIQLEFDI